MNNQAYISDVYIQNFQSHKETYLKLCPGVNALAGDSDAGKSAVFRALEWLFTNKPAGEEFKSHWGGAVEVSVCLQPDNIWLGKVRGKGGTYYWIGDDIVQNRLSGFGAGAPPQPVLDLLNMASTNFQGQMTLPFLLSLGPTKAGKFFNDAADLNVIDSSISNIDSKLWKARHARDLAATDEKSLKKKLADFDWLDQAGIELEALETLDKEVQDKTFEYNHLIDICDSLEEIDGLIKKKAPVLEAEDAVSSAVKLDQELKEVEKERTAVNNLLQAIIEIDQSIADYDIINAEQEIKKCMNMVQEINTLTNKQSHIMVAKLKFVKSDELWRQEKNVVKKMRENFSEIFPKECPLCGEATWKA